MNIWFIFPILSLIAVASTPVFADRLTASKNFVPHASLDEQAPDGSKVRIALKLTPYESATAGARIIEVALPPQAIVLNAPQIEQSFYLGKFHLTVTPRMT